MLDTLRRAGRLVAVGAAAAGAALAFATPGAAGPGRPDSVRPADYRAGAGPVVTDDAAYEYAPTILAEGGRYRMWWCAQVPGSPVKGDDILYAESTDLNGPFHAPGSDAPYTIAFHGTGGEEFDGQHTCDPSVVNVGGRYLMYYGAAVHDGETSIGLATSADGITWQRSAQPIITAAHQKDVGNHYGAGQPTVTFVDGTYYLMFTDTTGAGSDANGNGQFLWRSADPSFGNGTEVYTADGWQPRTDANSRSYSVLNAVSTDLQYSDQLKAFIVAHDNDAGHTTLSFLDNAEPKAHPYQDVTIDGNWAEGPGIVSTADRHALAGTGEQCNVTPVDVVHADHNAPNNGPPQELRHYGIDLVSDASCDSGPAPSASASAPASASPSDAPSPSASASRSPSHAAPSASGTAGGGGLPVTGTKLGYLIGGGAVLLAAGAGLWLLARRRRGVA